MIKPYKRGDLWEIGDLIKVPQIDSFGKYQEHVLVLKHDHSWYYRVIVFYRDGKIEIDEHYWLGGADNLISRLDS